MSLEINVKFLGNLSEVKGYLGKSGIFVTFFQRNVKVIEDTFLL